jgi:hypothetical protein
MFTFYLIQITFTMRSFTTSFAAIIFSLSILTSCDQKAIDINVSELETPCDYVNAMLKVTDAASLIIGDKTKSDLNDSEKQRLEDLQNKYKEIGYASKNAMKTKSWKESEFRDCSNYAEMEESELKLRDRRHQ